MDNMLEEQLPPKRNKLGSPLLKAPGKLVCKPVDWAAELAWQPFALIAIVCSSLYLVFPIEKDTYANWPIDPYAEYINYTPSDRYMEIKYGVFILAYTFIIAVIVCIGEFSYTYPQTPKARRVLNVLNLGLAYLETVAWFLTLSVLAKTYVGEPRPRFMAVCLGDDFTKSDIEANLAANGGQLKCNDEALEREARHSFPSGHASASMVCGMFLFMYLFWMMYSRPVYALWSNYLQPSHLRFVPVIKQTLYPLAFLSVAFGLSVCAQRVIQFFHHIWDVNAGAILGLLCVVPLFLRVTVFVNDQMTEAFGGVGSCITSNEMEARVLTSSAYQGVPTSDPDSESDDVLDLEKSVNF